MLQLQNGHNAIAAFVAQCIVCKHIMKVFKMLHLNICDDSIVKEGGTLHRLHEVVQFSNTTIMNAILEMMIPQMNNLDKKQS
jgi:hypothetical protein